jgi:dipeptidyl aminopeptidase/acylaminoacyl peptidase
MVAWKVSSLPLIHIHTLTSHSSTYAPLTGPKLLAFYNLDGAKRAIVIDVATGDFTDPDIPINDVSFNTVKRTSPSSFAVIGSTAEAPKTLYHIDLSNGANMKALKTSMKISFPKTFFSPAQNIKYPRTRSPEGGHAYGLFFPPTNPDFTAPNASLPPLIVAIHGGPTWQTGAGLSLRDQYWTTRGYALMQVNYVGSSGYGKAYASLLNAQWGIADIADAASAVDHLAAAGLIDKSRVGITGLSAGGYATMQALVVYPDVFAAGVAESGISDLKAMFDETHKFESRYLQPLCFPADTHSSDEEKRQIIVKRSPIHNASRIKSPLLILGGRDDKIVPPSQATRLAAEIEMQGGEVEVVVYEGEGHISTRGENVRDSVERAEGWWRRFLLREAI